MSYAATLGRREIVEMLRSLGAADLSHAFERACLMGEIDTARRLHEMGARPAPDVFMGLAETQNVACFDYLISLGAEIRDAQGSPLAVAALVLETYVRHPGGKHAFLERLEAHGVALPDTAPMAVHRGRIDLLKEHLRRDPGLLSRRFSHREIYPTGMGCHDDQSLALHGTPIAGGTLLHLCVDYDEIEIAQWLIGKGADVDFPALVDTEGWGGHTPLFGCVVSQPYRVGRRRDDAFARLLLDHGADPNARSSLRKRLRFVPDESMHEYRDVTPLSWGERFHDRDWVSPAAMRLIEERGGRA
jgi:ankyrin repeat protein